MSGVTRNDEIRMVTKIPYDALHIHRIMVTKGIIKHGEYFDSVSLMIAARELTKIEGIQEAAVVMGTPENKLILKTSAMLLPELEAGGGTDLLIGLKADDNTAFEAALGRVESLLDELRQTSDDSQDFLPKSVDGALKVLPDANIALISVAGKYAAAEARKALERGLHVMLFSDNVPVEQEIELKQFARDKGLLLMGPDCGTAIINGVPLAFANVVHRGNIGIVAASGTGLQEVCCVISNEGGGISQAVGTGGRDVKRDVGGMMFLEALRALKEDPNTTVIVLVSKPPDDDVLKKIRDELQHIQKPVVTNFIGADPDIITQSGAMAASTLEEAGMLAVALSQGQPAETVRGRLRKRRDELKARAAEEAEKRQEAQKYISGVFSGGTLCDEAQLVLREIVGNVFSNTPITPEYTLDDPTKDRDHTILDLGEDEFTVGRPHPMIDFSLRTQRMLEEAGDPAVAVILFDVVLGYGAHPRPAEELVPVLTQMKTLAKEDHRHLSLVCSITGTDSDPQGKRQVAQTFEQAGVWVMPSNAAASEFAGYIC